LRRQAAASDGVPERREADSPHRDDRDALEKQHVFREVRLQSKQDRQNERKARWNVRQDLRNRGARQANAVPLRQCLPEQDVPRVVDDQSGDAIEAQHVEDRDHEDDDRRAGHPALTARRVVGDRLVWKDVTCLSKNRPSCVRWYLSSRRK